MNDEKIMRIYDEDVFRLWILKEIEWVDSSHEWNIVYDGIKHLWKRL